jgi:tetratricopeptide (TPR) repeat protein
MNFRRIAVILVLIAVFAYAPRLLRVGQANLARIVLDRAWIQGFENGGYVPCEYITNESNSVEQLQDFFSLIPLRSDEMGRALWLNGHCSEAVKTWTEALDSLPQENSAVLGMLLTGRTDFVPLEILSDVSEYAYMTGMIARAHDNLGASAQWYGLSLDLFPQRKTATELARLYREQGYFESERDVWQRVIKISTETMPDHWWAIGKLAELENNWQIAAQAYQTGANLTNEPFEYWMRSGDLNEKIEAWHEAEKAYQQALTVAPQNWRPYFALGYLNEQQTKYDDAITWYMKAVAIAPKSIDTLYGLGHAYYLMGNDGLAQSYLRDALGVSPNHTWTAYYLAQSLYRSGNRIDAVKSLDSAITSHPGKPWEWAVQLGDWEQEANNCQGAKDAYQRAVSMGASLNTISARQSSLLSSCP